MHLQRVVVTLVAIVAASICSTSATPDTGRGKPTPPPKVCNPRARGPNLEKQQQEATADFAHIFLELNQVKAAFDRYVPGQYIQHNPNSQQGREYAIQVLTAIRADPTIVTSHITTFSGEGYGGMHYKVIRPATENLTLAIFDYFRFEGTCIVEHWDVSQRILGNETNPIAFF
ncbi:hypothetical protein FA15DRAFT_717785 [Coprinopsis marcescibilis]|uniref:SnoaL-like domain-containing protein n=1 Tax=Coprinopsis marcescibilis TaxID=230819 RepID=A0A5C3KLI0_COPMA|nr:hypothetical protein FA15DRAFT_717785 [Coprinopsis marcescibilis]